MAPVAKDSCSLTFSEDKTPKISGEEQVATYLRMALAGSVLEGATLEDCTLNKVSFAGRDIRRIKFHGVKTAGLTFDATTDAEEAEFVDSDLTGADLSQAKLKSASFTGATKLAGARMIGSHLEGVNFERVNMDGADLSGAYLKDVGFDPSALPSTDSVAHAHDLDTMLTWTSPQQQTEDLGEWKRRLAGHSPEVFALEKLAEDLVKNGFIRQAQDVNFAMRRAEQHHSWYQCSTGFDYSTIAPTSSRRSKQFEACFLYTVRKVGLDWTVEFGRRPWRPLGILAVLSLVWILVLSIWLPFAPRRSVGFVVNTSAGPGKPILMRRLVRIAYPRAKRPFAYIRIACAMTLASAFDLPFKDVDVGRWFRLVAAREYGFEIRGALRIWNGWFSLLCFYLLMIWILSYFQNSMFSATT